VAEVDERDELFRVELGEVQPQGLAGTAGPQVPQRVDDRARRHVDDPLLRTEPAEL
jgi:hypothetical protein